MVVRRVSAKQRRVPATMQHTRWREAATRSSVFMLLRICWFLAGLAKLTYDCVMLCLLMLLRIPRLGVRQLALPVGRLVDHQDLRAG